MFRRNGQNGDLARQPVKNREYPGQFGCAVNDHDRRTGPGREGHRLDPAVEAEGFQVRPGLFCPGRGNPARLEIGRIREHQIEAVLLVAYPFCGIPGFDTDPVAKRVGSQGPARQVCHAGINVHAGHPHFRQPERGGHQGAATSAANLERHAARLLRQGGGKHQGIRAGPEPLFGLKQSHPPLIERIFGDPAH